jgi:peptidoglycan/xylan/chitin deacetylase (PgdA/CDA1 family)
VITFDAGYDDGFLYALSILQHHSFVATYFIVTGRIGRPGDLTADQVRALASAGMEIGDHAADQLGLARLSMAKMRFQVETSTLAIEALTGSRPTTFAYPFGSDDPVVAAEVARAGFALAVTSIEGVGESAWNRSTVPRLRVGPSMPAAALVNMVSRYP